MNDMNSGLDAGVVERIRGVLTQFPELEKAVLYGSRAMGTFKPGSDIDLTLLGPALTPDLLASISIALDDLLLPLTMDLSLFDSLDNRELRDHIERVGVELFRR